MHFYKDVVGLRLIPHHDHHPAFELGHEIFLVIVQGRTITNRQSEQSSFPVIAFAVDDLENAVASLETHGVDLPWGVEESAESRWVKFYDSAGNLIEFVQFTNTQDT